MHANQPRFSIRIATRSDADGILHCLHEAFEPFRGDYSLEGFTDTALTPDSLQKRFESMVILVAVSDHGEIVGTVACNVVSPGEGHFRGMAVLLSWQGAGVAAQLLQTVETELRERKCSRVTLDTTQPLQRAIRFYEKNGYKLTGKVGDHFGMPLFEYSKTLMA